MRASPAQIKTCRCSAARRLSFGFNAAVSPREGSRQPQSCISCTPDASNPNIQPWIARSRGHADLQKCSAWATRHPRRPTWCGEEARRVTLLTALLRLPAPQSFPPHSCCFHAAFRKADAVRPTLTDRPELNPPQCLHSTMSASRLLCRKRIRYLTILTSRWVRFYDATRLPRTLPSRRSRPACAMHHARRAPSDWFPSTNSPFPKTQRRDWHDPTCTRPRTAR